MSKKKVLIVDDDHDLRDTMSLALSSEGYNVLTAENGKIALALLQKLDTESLPDCIVLDMMMPEMDGKAFIETVRTQHQNFAKIPILVATAKGSPTDPVGQLPGTRKIRKPMELEDLFFQIKEMCARPASIN